MKILVIADTRSRAAFLADQFREFGHQALGMNGDGETTRRLFAGADAVVITVELPGTAGATLGRELAGLRPDVPIGFVVGAGKRIDEHGGSGQPCPVLDKWWTARDLEAFLQTLVSQRAAAAAALSTSNAELGSTTLVVTPSVEA